MVQHFGVRVDSQLQGMEILDNDPDVGFVYTPLEITPQLARLKRAIERSDFSFGLQGTFRDWQVEDWPDIERDKGFNAADLPFEFKQCAEGRYLLDVKKTLSLKSAFADKAYSLENGPRDLAISRFLLQSNNGRLSMPNDHQDDASDITVNIYLSGKGMTYYDGKNTAFRMKPAVMTMHRGLDHHLAQDNPALATRHTGHDHKNMLRANFIITMLPRAQVAALPCLADTMQPEPAFG